LRDGEQSVDGCTLHAVNPDWTLNAEFNMALLRRHEASASLFEQSKLPKAGFNLFVKDQISVKR
jgi:hypothetical protein